MKFVILISNSWLEYQVLSSFSLPKLQKVGGKGNLHHVGSFMNIPTMKSVVACIDEYLGRSAPWRTQDQKIFL